MTTPARRFLLLLCLVAVVAAGVALATAWVIHSRASAKAPDAHQWLHDQLQLTAAQEEQLIPMERRFAQERTALVEEIRGANRDLAAAIRAEGRWGPAVEAAIDRGQRAQGALQKLTVRHCLDMQSVLTPEQSRRLMEIAAQALGRDAD